MKAAHWIVDIMSVIFLIPKNEFGGNVMMKISLKLVLYQQGFIFERVIKKLMSGSTYVLFVVNIRTSHLKNTVFFFKN